MKTMVSGFKAGFMIALLGAFMAGCGGGGGSSSSGTTTTTLAGTAAKGAAFASVTVAIKDKNGSTKTGTTGTDGKYTIDTTGMTAPFIMKVSDGTNTYYSVSTATGTATANIHQFTDLIIRNWYKVKGTDIDTEFSGSGALSQVPTATEIDTIAAVVVNILSSWLSTVGIDASTFNLITSSFSADGTGFDKVLDNNTVTIDASGNVTVTSNDPTTGTESTIATMTITTDLTGGTHASGTYTWNSTTGVQTINWTSSNFVCDGPGSTTIKTGVTITSTTMTADGGDTWTRSSGTAGDIIGTWTATDSTTGNSFTLTFNTDGTVSLVGVIVSCGSGGGTTSPAAQVVNNSGGRIDHVNVGNVTFSDNLSYNISLYTSDNGSYCGDGCSTGFPDVAEGTNNVVVYQTATSTPVSVGSLGSFVAGNDYAVNIRNVSGSYCAELWQRLDTSGVFNNDTTRVLIGTTCPDTTNIYSYSYYKRYGTATPQTATLENGILNIDGKTISGVYQVQGLGGSTCLAGGSGNDLTACWSPADAPQTMLLCGPDPISAAPGTLLYVLFDSPDANRVSATATSFLNALQSETGYLGTSVYTNCSGWADTSWIRDYPSTNYYLWPDVFTTYSGSYVANLLSGAVIFSTPTAGNNYKEYAVVRVSPTVFEVWH